MRCVAFVMLLPSRRAAVFVSLIMMAVSTFSMGCLPTYDQVGIAAPILLVFVRLCQGLSVGGQLIGTYDCGMGRAKLHADHAHLSCSHTRFHHQVPHLH